MFLRSYIHAFITIASFTSICGCSGSNPNAPANIIGKVTYKGTAVPAGTVQLIKDGVSENDPGMITIQIQPDGTFTGSDFPIGNFAVLVETDSIKGNEGSGKNSGLMKLAQQSMPPGAKERMKKADYMKIPAKYSKKQTSGLNTSLSAGKNELILDLSD